jgi:hypothetical protein
MRRLLVSIGSCEAHHPKPGLPMRKMLPLCLMALLLGAGCATHYTITLDNGAQIATKSKPKLKNGVYYYKDIQGKDAGLPSGRVAEIAPSSMTKKEKEPFTPGRLH